MFMERRNTVILIWTICQLKIERRKEEAFGIRPKPNVFLLSITVIICELTVITTYPSCEGYRKSSRCSLVLLHYCVSRDKNKSISHRGNFSNTNNSE